MQFKFDVVQGQTVPPTGSKTGWQPVNPECFDGGECGICDKDLESADGVMEYVIWDSYVAGFEVEEYAHKKCLEECT